jgi:hypothetical protein
MKKMMFEDCFGDFLYNCYIILKPYTVNAIVIKPKSKSNFDLVVTLAKKLGEKQNL